MQIELRTRTIEPQRKTFTHLVKRYGDRPASRYEEGSVDVQAVENFHYRPAWDSERWQYDPDYSAFKLTDPYAFLDPRQFYYAPYVQSRAAMDDAFSKSLDYLESRDYLHKLPDGWQALITDVLVPLRHYEAGCQLITIEGARWAWGTTIDQCCTYASFDRVGNAQRISRVGLAMDGGGDAILVAGKERWMTDPALQGMRRFVEEQLVVRDWAKELMAIDLADRLLYDLLYRHLDEAAVLGAAGPYSLVAQHFAAWFADQRRWIDQLVKVWFADEQYADANRAAFDEVLVARWSQIVEAVSDVAAAIDARIDSGAAAAVQETAARLADDLAALGLTVPGGK